MNRFRTCNTAVLGGILLGLMISALLAAYLPSGRDTTSRPEGVLLSDCDGVLDQIVLHYTTDSASIVGETYRQFLSQLPETTTVHVVCPKQDDFDHLVDRLGQTHIRLKPLIVDHPVTCWSRDRWIAMADGNRATLLTPREELGADVWVERAGDGKVGADLAAGLQNVRHRRSSLLFDGGDFVTDDRVAVVTPDVLKRNLQQTVQTRLELIERLEKTLGRRVVLFDRAPDHHAGMFMMTLGNGHVLVGDPDAGKRLVQKAGLDPKSLCGDGGADFSKSTAADFDSVADRCRTEGYAVHRIPVVPGKDGRTYLSYLNVILDQRDGVRTVYLPVFGEPALDEPAAQTWRSLGFKVHAVDCSSTYPHFGSLRCLVNVLRRG